MATNLLQGGGRVIQHANTSHAALSSGDLCLLGAGGPVGLVLEDIANNGTGSVMVGPIVVSTSVKGHNGSANAAVTAGATVYFTDTEAFCDVDTAQVPAGITLGSVASGATETEEVLLLPLVTAP